MFMHEAFRIINCPFNYGQNCYIYDSLMFQLTQLLILEIFGKDLVGEQDTPEVDS